ncbi:hypothetical protein GOBAR_AA15120 [Gossypium barbadense]|uniref:Serine-threonine/tyrosine-protein kinase catalytic domain-containing protein n=1 Tax=Gossypium barbadense TaxID=3634 RepID=A0A2P5XQC1_GOSBA|nr:hypothetical protein GOBAR_AA15120 [Gossypium barbadense]
MYDLSTLSSSLMPDFDYITCFKLTEVNYLGQLNHSNLVKLFGYCCEDEHRLLVYEYMASGSLEKHLFRMQFCQILLRCTASVTASCKYYRAPEIIFGATKYTTAIDICSSLCLLVRVE